MRGLWTHTNLTYTLKNKKEGDRVFRFREYLHQFFSQIKTGWRIEIIEVL